MIYIGILLTIFTICKLSLDFHQLNYIKEASVSDQEMNELGVDQNFINRSNSYGIHKLYLSMVSTLVTIMIVYFVFLSNGFGMLNSLTDNMSLDIFGKNLSIIFVFFLLLSIINIPTSYIKTFYIEEKFGFNKMSKVLFLRDLITNLFLSLIIVAITFKLFETLFINYTDLWWFYLWILLIFINILSAYIYPSLIAPIFNKFKKLDDSVLNSSVLALTEKLSFPIEDLYVMDGSKRSSHSNAYFSGLFGKKRIVFFDTLLNILTLNEIKSVLAHEIGHYKEKHILKSMVLFGIISLLFLYTFFIILNFLIIDINIPIDLAPSFVAILFVLVSPLLSFFLMPFLSALSRRNEFEADDYAKTHTESKDLISSLVKLSKGNLSLVKSSPIYAYFYSSHPSVFDRIKNLKK